MNLFTKLIDNKLCMRTFAKWIAVFLCLALIFNFGTPKKAHADDRVKKDSSFVPVKTIKDDLNIGGVEAALIGYYGLNIDGRTYYSFYRVVPTHKGQVFSKKSGAYLSSPLELSLMDEDTKINLTQSIGQGMTERKDCIDDVYNNFTEERAEKVIAAVTDMEEDNKDEVFKTFLIVTTLGLAIDVSLIKLITTIGVRCITNNANNLSRSISSLNTVSSQWEEEAVINLNGTLLSASDGEILHPGLEIGSFYQSEAGLDIGSFYQSEAGSVYQLNVGQGVQEAGAAAGAEGATGCSILTVIGVVVVVMTVILICYLIYETLHSPLQVAHIHNLGIDDGKGIVNLDGIDGYDDGINITWSLGDKEVGQVDVSHIFWNVNSSELKSDCDCITISTPFSGLSSQLRNYSTDPDWKTGQSNLHYNLSIEKRCTNYISNYLDSLKDLSYKYCYVKEGRDLNDWSSMSKAIYNGFEKNSNDYLNSNLILRMSLSDDAKARLSDIKLHEEYDFDKSMKTIYNKYANDSDKTQRNKELRANIEAYQEWYNVMSEEYRNELGPKFVGSMNMWYPNMEDWEFDLYESYDSLVGGYH